MPGKPDESELVRRIDSRRRDRGDAAAGDEEAAHGRAEGRSSGGGSPRGPSTRTHWAFVPPKRPALPAVKQADWPRNPIDHFVLARLENGGAEAVAGGRPVHARPPRLPRPDRPAADARRRSTRSSTTSRPTPTRGWSTGCSPSPHYGERWARRWLDLARYADTNGYEKDRPRSIWPYRDWVIRALNADMPFDRFTIEQLAGDMLPGATPRPEDRHRLPPQHDAQRGGRHRPAGVPLRRGDRPRRDDRHRLARPDRSAAPSATRTSTTRSRTREYYQLFAFLNNADEPAIEVPTPEIAAERGEAEAKIAARDRRPAEAVPADRWPTDDGRRRRAAQDTWSAVRRVARSRAAKAVALDGAPAGRGEGRTCRC